MLSRAEPSQVPDAHGHYGDDFRAQRSIAGLKRMGRSVQAALDFEITNRPALSEMKHEKQEGPRYQGLRPVSGGSWGTTIRRPDKAGKDLADERIERAINRWKHAHGGTSRFVRSNTLTRTNWEHAAQTAS